jgi:DNA-binding NarL/FixJ family response regulator
VDRRAHACDVAGYASRSVTNKQIASMLYISDKTAEHHVSRILGKLGSTRERLPDR